MRFILYWPCLIFSYLLMVFISIPASQLQAFQGVKAGPFQGHTTTTSMKVWLMVKNVDKADLILRNDKNGNAHSKTIVTDTLRNYNLISPLTFHFKDLQPGTKYTAKARLDDHVTDYLNTLATKTETRPDSFSFLIGSCAFLPPILLRPFLPSSPVKAFQALAQQKDADFMIWLGDYLYYWTKHYNTAYYPKYWRHIKKRKNKAVDNFLKTMPQYAIWDDHDYGPNNSDGSYRFKEQSLKLHKQFWANPSYGTTKTPGVFTSFRHHDAAFFLTDARYHRTEPQDGKGEMLGNAQMEWLKEQLLQTDAPFKFIIVSNQVLNKATKHETHSNYTDEHNELLDFIKAHSIEGVVFISGDRHFTELTKRAKKDFYPFYDLTCSGLSSIPNNTKEPNKDRVDGTWTNRHNFGKLTLKGQDDNRKLVIRIYNIKRELVWDYTIALSAITTDGKSN